ncbi:MAG: sensor histidine kinase [Ferruginibacter sp.]|nr:sensor histidine kinase [Cytophagales bacterium]
MQSIAGEVPIVIAITLLLLLITAFVVVFFFIYQHQYHTHLQEKEDMQNTYQQELLKAQLEMKEQTLHTISQEIHDNIGQILSLVKLNLSAVLLEDDNPAARKIMDTKDLVSKAIQDLRNLSKTLNTEYISHQKLSESLQFELDLIQKSGLYETNLRVDGAERPFDPQKQLIIFRIAQEILNNIIKHARARRIAIVLNYRPDSLNVSIEDDGAGFDASALPQANGHEKGTGIGNVYHRAKLIGADFVINSHLGKGTLAHLSLPTHA